jgi:hypothetical protein
VKETPFAMPVKETPFAMPVREAPFAMPVREAPFAMPVTNPKPKATLDLFDDLDPLKKPSPGTAARQDDPGKNQTQDVLLFFDSAPQPRTKPQPRKPTFTSFGYT